MFNSFRNEFADPPHRADPPSRTSARICPFARRVLPRDVDSISNSLRNFQLVPERVPRHEYPFAELMGIGQLTD